MQDLQREMEAKVAAWKAGMTEVFGARFEGDAFQCELASRGGNRVLLTPSVPDAAMFMTGIFPSLPDGDTETLEYVLARNLFMSDTSGGWFAFEPSERRICYQYRWDEFLFSEFSAFLPVLTVFTERTDGIGTEIADHIRLRSAGAQGAATHEPGAMIRI